VRLHSDLCSEKIWGLNGSRAQEILPFYMFRLAQRPAQPLIQWITWFFPKVNQLGQKLITHPHLVLSRRLFGAIALLPLYAFRHGHGHLRLLCHNLLTLQRGGTSGARVAETSRRGGASTARAVHAFTNSTISRHHMDQM
jgi:hypothetical protein